MKETFTITVNIEEVTGEEITKREVTVTSDKIPKISVEVSLIIIENLYKLIGSMSK